jgi:hypothetical protein
VLFHSNNANNAESAIIANNVPAAKPSGKLLALSALMALLAFPLLALSFRLIRAKCESNDRPACFTKSAISREVR